MRGPKANRELSLVLTALSLTACMAPVGTSGVISVPPDATQTCTQHCQTIGMRLTAVAPSWPTTWAAYASTRHKRDRRLARPLPQLPRRPTADPSACTQEP